MSDTTFEWNDLLACEFAGFLEHRLKYNSPSDIPSILYLFKENKRLEKKWESEELDKNSEQKPWTILSFRGPMDSIKKHRWILQNKGEYLCEFNPTFTFPLESMINGSGWTVKSGDLIIESVRRNSDGKIFTLGDRVINNNNNEIKDIMSFFIIEPMDKIYVRVPIFSGGPLKSWDIWQIHHAPKILFVTNDDVAIFPGMPYWSVDPDFTILFSGGAGDGSGTEPGRKYFSTEEVATQYVWDNKPIWSRKDFREIIRVLEEKITLKTDSDC